MLASIAWAAMTLRRFSITQKGIDMKSILKVLAVIVIVAGPALAQNYDLLSFGKKVRFAGLVSTGRVSLGSSCPAPNPALPRNRCIVLAAAGTTTNFDERNIGHISLPGAARAITLVYHVTSITSEYEFQNSTGAAVPSAVFNVQPYVTLESAALNGVNHPITGQPLNGAIDLNINAMDTTDRSLAAGERDHQLHRVSHGAETGIGKLHLLSLGLSPAVVNNVFNGLFTYRLNVKGSANYVTSASIAYDLRLFTD
jgi:hypothetical protein